MVLSEQARPKPRSLSVSLSLLSQAAQASLARARLPFPVILYLLAVIIPISLDIGIALTGVRIVLILMIVPMTYRLVTGAYGRLLVTDVFFFMHIAWAAVAMAQNNPEQMVTNMGSTGIEFLGGYMLARAYIRTAEDFVALVKWLGVAAIFLVPVALAEARTGWSPVLTLLGKLPVIETVKDIRIGPRLGLERVQTVFAHPIHSGFFFAIIYCLTFVGLKGVLPDWGRFLVTGCAVLCTFLALSSGALLAILLISFLIGWAWLWGENRQKWWVLFGLVILTYIAIDVLSSRTPFRVFLTYATFSPHTAYNRSITFEWGMVNVWANPLFGIGLNDWVRPRWMHSGSMDNFWLVMAVRYGIPGFLALAIGYTFALFGIGLRDFRSDPLLMNLRRAWMICMVGMTFTLCTVHVWHTIYSFVFFIFGAGMWLLQVHPIDDAATAGVAPAVANVPRGRTAIARRSLVVPSIPHRLVVERVSAPERFDSAPRRQVSQHLGVQSRGETHRYTRFPPRAASRRKDGDDA